VSGLTNKLDAFAFLLDLTDAIYISDVNACLAFAKCHGTIVLLFDLVVALFITHMYSLLVDVPMCVSYRV
jgi:hypothetical protein